MIHKYKTKVPLYPFQLAVIIGTGTVARLLEKSLWFGDQGADSSGSAAYTIRHKNATVVGVVFKIKDLTHVNIAHEAFHATVAILNGVGNKYSDKGEEAYAYLNGWVGGVIYRKIKEWKLEVR